MQGLDIPQNSMIQLASNTTNVVQIHHENGSIKPKKQILDRYHFPI
jgi:hypothetical protein